METRTSRSLEQFCSSLDDAPNEAAETDPQPKQILDLASVNQGTIMYIAGAGHRLYSEDFLAQLDECFGGGDFYANQTKPELVTRFLDTALNFPEAHFDAALVWDSLQFLAPSLLETVMERLQCILKPGGHLLAIFHASEQPGPIPAYAFRIVDRRTLGIAVRGTRQPAQQFNNRSLERLFECFDSVKFFLTRDHLREIIVRR